MCLVSALSYIIAQFLGGTIAAAISKNLSLILTLFITLIFVPMSIRMRMVIR